MPDQLTVVQIRFKGVEGEVTWLSVVPADKLRSQLAAAKVNDSIFSLPTEVGTVIIDTREVLFFDITERPIEGSAVPPAAS
jgi:hypothetical protein